MKLDVPAGHQVGMHVPLGGSSCAKCEYVSKDGKKCSNTYFKKWNGSDVLPERAESYCCDFFQADAKTGRATLGEQLRAQKARK